MALELTELDAVEVIVIVDNEVDPMSPYPNKGLQVSGRFPDVAMNSKFEVTDRGEVRKEFRFDNLCCGAHGLSLMITGIKGESRRTILFDTGPEKGVWQQNAARLDAQIENIEVIQLSHWHTDHSGGMLQAIPMIKEAKRKAGEGTSQGVTIDLHPSRPDYRGAMLAHPVSLEADPSFEEIEAVGGTIHKSAEAHTVLDDMFLISGEIPRVTAYELGLRVGIRFDNVTKTWSPDQLIQDERLLMCRLKDKGIVAFTGCGHAGVVNTAMHALQLGGGSTPLYAVMGGYHLVDGDEKKIQDTVTDLKALDPQLMLPGHCSGWRIKMEIETQMPGRLAPSTVGTRFVL